MPVWPKSFHAIRATLLTARTSAQLRQGRRDAREQPRVFARLTRPLAASAFWREAGIEPGMAYARFRTRVAPRDYAQLAPAIERMKRGETGVLWPGRCALFAVTSGTTTGQPRHLPVTNELLAHFRSAGRAALHYYTARIGHAGVFRGRHLLLGGTTALLPLAEAQPREALAGDITGITALNLPGWVERHLYEPGPAIARLPDGTEKNVAIAERVRGRDVSLIAGLPGTVLPVARLLRAGVGKARPMHLQALWPNLECFVHGGTPLGPFQDELREAIGPGVSFHEVYAAAEGVFAAQDAAASAGLRLLADRDVFFEFVPLAEFEATPLDQVGPRALPLAEVKTGVDYAVLITTPAGLARYALGDVVRFVSTEPPRLVHVGRTALQLTSFGEHVGEKDLTDALVAVVHRHHWTIVNFHVAPLFHAGSLTGNKRGRHEWWLELRPGTVETPTGPAMAAELDAELQRANDSYAARRRAGALDAPTVRLVMPGVFEHWLRFQGRWGGQHKLPRSRNDRQIADELAQVTNFARD